MDFQIFNLIRNPVDAIWLRKEWVLLILEKFLRDKSFFAWNPEIYFSAEGIQKSEDPRLSSVRDVPDMSVSNLELF